MRLQVDRDLLTTPAPKQEARPRRAEEPVAQPLTLAAGPGRHFRIAATPRSSAGASDRANVAVRWCVSR